MKFMLANRITEHCIKTGTEAEWCYNTMCSGINIRKWNTHKELIIASDVVMSKSFQIH
jgi:hypothetical protein